MRDGAALVFIGFMGAGKTSAARAVAAELNARPADSDVVLEQRLGMSIEDWFATHGEHAFREEEEAAVVELLDRAGGPDTPVVSLGGGAVTSDRVQQALARHTVVLLDVDTDTAWQRAGGRRPLARDRRRFDELHAERLPLYERLADAILPTSRRESVRHALPHIRALPEGAKLLWAEAASGSYPVLVGDGLVRDLPPGVVVTDGAVGALYGPADAITIPSGEQHKTLATVEAVLREMARRGVDHDGRVVALGGGVVGDVAGFCAAVYQRGIPVVQVPTTVVAQVDSAYGGKTGVDLPEGKNYAGAYHQPAAVLADPSTLASLPAAEAAAGWAEVVKTALIAGGRLWKRVREAPPVDARSCSPAPGPSSRSWPPTSATAAAARCSTSATRSATRSRRRRATRATGTGRRSASACSRRSPSRPGTRCAPRSSICSPRAACRPAWTRRSTRGAVQDAVQRDKKRRGGVVGFVVVDAPGQVRPGVPVPDDMLRAALEELAA